MLNLFTLVRWKEGSQINQYIMAVMVTFPTLIDGMIEGWVSPAIPILQDPNGPLDKPLTESHLAWMASLIFLVSFPAILLTGYFADRFGRKAVMLMGIASFIICWCIKLIWMRSETIIVARAIAGIGNGIVFTLTPVYVKEISDSNIRGVLGSMLILAQNSGFVIMYTLGATLSFLVVLWIAFAVPIVHLILFLGIPDSPSYLLKKGKIQEATEVLAWLRSVDPKDTAVAENIIELDAEQREENTLEEETALQTFLKDKQALKALGVCIVLLSAAECSGYLVLLTYASEVFGRASIGEVLSPNQQTIVLGVLQLMGSIVACNLVEKTGRKTLLIITSFLTGVGMLALGSWFYASSLGLHAPGWVPITAMGLSIFCTAAGFQPVPFVILPEMFKYKLRGLASSLAVSLTALVDFAQTETYESVTDVIGEHGTFWSFAVICFLATIFTIFVVPETKDKTIKDIYKCFESKRRKSDCCSDVVFTDNEE